MIEPFDLLILDYVANATNAKLILNLGMPTSTPVYASDMINAYKTYITPSNIYAIEVGNELDHAFKQGWRPASYSPQNYFTEYEAYSTYVRQNMPGVDLMGPSYAYDWREAGYQIPFYDRFKDTTKYMSYHKYALRGCATVNTIDMLLDGTHFSN